MTIGRWSVVALVLVARASTASAQAPSETALAPPPVEYRWTVHSYRASVVAADLVSVGLIVADTQALGNGEITILTAAGVAGLFLAAPTVHFAHGNWKNGLASLGLRIMLPSIGGGIGSVFGPQDKPRCPTCETESTPGFVVGFVGGLVTASLIDAFLLAERPERKLIWPTLSASHSSFTLGAAGKF